MNHYFISKKHKKYIRKYSLEAQDGNWAVVGTAPAGWYQDPWTL